MKLRGRRTKPEMASAATIQRGHAAEHAVERLRGGPALDIFARMVPAAREVGGDLYDVVKLDGNARSWSRSATFAAKAFRPRCSWRSRKPSYGWWSVPAKTFRRRSRQPTSGWSPTIERTCSRPCSCGVIDAASGTLIYRATVVTITPLVLRRGRSTFEPLRNCGPPLGVLEESNYVPRSIALPAPGDMLLLYTDGVTEARKPPNPPSSG